MAGTPHSAKADFAKVVERQMRNWELARAQRHPPRGDATPADVVDFVTISRAVGSGGSLVATALGEKLHWPVFDREILQAMAGDDQLRARLYEHMDERDVSWLDAAVRWLIRGELPKDDYFYRLTESVLALARQGHAIFLGRAADLILPRERGLRVRVTASLETRAKTYAERTGVSEALAMAEVERIDRERQEFRRRFAAKTPNDVTRHDLVLNMDRLSVDQAVEIIRAALRARGIGN